MYHSRAYYRIVVPFLAACKVQGAAKQSPKGKSRRVGIYVPYALCFLTSFTAPPSGFPLPSSSPLFLSLSLTSAPSSSMRAGNYFVSALQRFDKWFVNERVSFMRKLWGKLESLEQRTSTDTGQPPLLPSPLPPPPARSPLRVSATAALSNASHVGASVWVESKEIQIPAPGNTWSSACGGNRRWVEGAGMGEGRVCRL